MKMLCMAMSVAAMAIAVSGCEMTEWSSASAVPAGTAASHGGPGLVSSSRRWVPDVAIPAGFDPVASRCRSETTMHGGREVSHLYQGRAGQSELVAFYQKHLPLDGWRAYDRMGRDGHEQLVFTKGVETLWLTFEQWDSQASVWVRINQGRPGAGLSLVP